MNSMFFVVCIVAIVFTAGIVKEWMKLKAKSAANKATPDEYLAQIETLEERIRVLERIVTENKFDLKKEIDKL
jgi:phage regulator Rha-like protein